MSNRNGRPRNNVGQMSGKKKDCKENAVRKHIAVGNYEGLWRWLGEYYLVSMQHARLSHASLGTPGIAGAVIDLLI